jgi:hypothetical protein
LGVKSETVARHFPGTGWSKQETNEYINAGIRANKLMRRMYA